MLAPFSCRLGKQCQYDATGVPMHRNIENSIDYMAVQASSDAIFAPKGTVRHLMHLFSAHRGPDVGMAARGS
jgi:hypothetical protein